MGVGQGRFLDWLITSTSAKARIILLVAAAMLAFAANSLLARLALGAGSADAAGYTGLRLLSGAAAFGLLIRLRHQDWRMGGSWTAATALLGYALLFSLAYLMLGAATGALILFASVQLGILAWAIINRDRPGALEWLGITVAVASLAFLVAPGLSAPSLLGAGLMAGAGFCWAVYTILGKGSASPLSDTAGNFIRCAPAAMPLLLVGFPRMTTIGAACAIASGIFASGFGYAVWYAALPKLSRTGAAYIQLTVPVIAALGGVALLGETLTGRMVLSTGGIIVGVALALTAAEIRRAARR
jgi:drug/metabolite transporter (DMT)-like permease